MSLVPRLRFKEFKGDWVEKKLGDVGDIITGSTPNTSNGQFYGGHYMFVSPTDIQQNRYIRTTTKTLTKLGLDEGRVVEKNSVCVVCIGSTIGKVGQLKDVAITNQQINTIKTNKDNSDDFIFSLLESKQDSIKNKANTHAIPIINKSLFSNFLFYFPSLSEQQKIANFLTTIDDKLETLKEKEKLLKEYKQGVVEKIFNQEIRFKKDDGSNFTKWEETELSNIAKIYQSKTISQSQFVSNGPYLVYGANGVIGRYNQYNHEQKQVIVSCRGSCGNVHFTAERSWITGNAMVINMDETLQCEKKFIYYQLSNTNFNYLITGSGQPQITSNIKNHKVFIPTLAEQQKIANFLTTIDEKIALLTSQIENTENYKQGLLQQMFI